MNIASVFLSVLLSVPWGIYAKPQHLVDIGRGRKMNLYCMGSGSPTVILDAGGGNNMSTWRGVQPSIAAFTRVCAYDRAGMGWSSPGPLPRSAANVVSDLHALLTAAKIAPPYVLVGHSIAGLFVRLYANEYLHDMAGLVLDDPSVEWQEQRFEAISPTYRSYMKKTMASKSTTKLTYANCMKHMMKDLSHDEQAMRCRQAANPSYQVAVNSEVQSLYGISSRQVSAARWKYGNLPLVVLTAGYIPAGYAGMSHSDMFTFYNLWVSMHDSLAQLSTRGFDCIVRGSDHGIQERKPMAVIDAVLDVVLQARRQEYKTAETALRRMCGSRTRPVNMSYR